MLVVNGVLMRAVATVILLAALVVAVPVEAQTPPRAPDAAGSSAGVVLARNLGGYEFPSIAATTSRMQNIAHAMRLRDYCSDRRVADAFVRVQLARFSLITGRPESCASLLDY